MSNDVPVFLKPNVVIEPLVMRWYAWTHLISPATAAMNAAYRHISIMESFIKAPSLHAEAIRTPSLRGGPFLNCPPSDVIRVEALLEETKAQQAQQIKFAEGIKEATRTVLKLGDGHSLAPIYPKLPEAVRGYVELFYTIGGGADLRIIEPLLYRSPIYNPSLQSALIYQINDDERAFAFSTPRLPRRDSIEFTRPFSDTFYDLLAELRYKPEPAKYVMDCLGLSGDQAAIFRGFFTESPPLQKIKDKTTHTRWRYFGHACVLVEAPDGTNALIDPVFAYQNGSKPERFTFADLPSKIDYVLLTHNHMDHVLIETLLALRPRIGAIIVPSCGGSLADPSLKLALNACGFNKVIELASLDYLEHGDFKFTALPFLGEHADLDIQTKAGWLVEAAGLSMLFAADSNNIEPRLYDILKPLIGEIDILFIGLECAGAPLSWVYGALLPRPLEQKKDNSRRLNGSDFPKAMEVIHSLNCKKVFVYAMGAEPWLSFITSIDPGEDTIPNHNAQELINACRQIGIPAERLYGSAEG